MSRKKIIKWLKIPAELNKASTNKLSEIQEKNLKYIEYQRFLGKHREANLFQEKLNKLTQVLAARESKPFTSVSIKKESVMPTSNTNHVATDRVLRSVKHALELMEQGYSVRAAVKEANVSLTSFYHNCSQQERDAATAKFTANGGKKQTVVSRSATASKGHTVREITPPVRTLSNVHQTENVDIMEEYNMLKQRCAKLEALVLENLLANRRS